MARGQIINRSVPTRRRADEVEFAIRSSASSEKVIELMRQAVLLCPEILDEPEPRFLIKRSGVHSATYAAIYFVGDSPDVLPARSMFLRQVRRLLDHAGAGASGGIPVEALLASTVLFEALSQAELTAIADALIGHDVEPGTVLFEQGDPGTGIYFVASGVFELARSEPATGKRILGRLGAGEFIGELGLVTGAPRGVTMTALTYGRIFELPRESLQHLLRSNTRLSAAMECSVRKGLDFLERDGVARAATGLDAPERDLLTRIKSFFLEAAARR